MTTFRSSRRPSPEVSLRPPKSNVSVRNGHMRSRVSPPKRHHCGVSRWFRSYGFADVLDDLFVGVYPTDSDDVAALERIGIRRVLNLTEDEEYRPGDRAEVERALAGAGIDERQLSLPDFGGLPPSALEAAVQEVNAWLDAGARTYVHCRAGWQRSAAVAAA